MAGERRSATTVAVAPPKRQSADGSRGGSTSHFLRSWAWKREHRPDRARFHRPYTYAMAPTTATPEQHQLTIQQAPFDAEGFASTVWDSSIVVAKMFELHSMRQQGAFDVTGRTCLDLSAGCGIVMAQLGAAVVATDLVSNLPLLRQNCEANTGDEDHGAVEVLEHEWGSSTSGLGGPFDIVVGCDVMYVDSVAGLLVATLVAVSAPHTAVIIAHGRNRQAEASFTAAAQEYFHISEVAGEELDELYQCSDVTVLLLQLKVPTGKRY